MWDVGHEHPGLSPPGCLPWCAHPDRPSLEMRMDMCSEIPIRTVSLWEMSSTCFISLWKNGYFSISFYYFIILRAIQMWRMQAVAYTVYHPFLPSSAHWHPTAPHCTACNSSDQKTWVFFYLHHTHVVGLKLLAGTCTCRCATESRGTAWDAAAQSLLYHPAHLRQGTPNPNVPLRSSARLGSTAVGIPACRAAGRQCHSPRPHSALIVLIAYPAQRAIIKTFC